MKLTSHLVSVSETITLPGRHPQNSGQGLAQRQLQASVRATTPEIFY